ncbi:MAG: hypothetical protein KIT19_11480 [Phycisphaeraceae bacterium]|nr:hypothetical protein [Phycisphaeraceae bacterium]
MLSEQFIFGETTTGRPYVIHRHHPRFVAQIMAAADAPTDGRVVHLHEQGLVIANFAWVDEVDGVDIEPVLRGLRRAACDPSALRAHRQTFPGDV